ncbi:MAG: hypothetical protein KC503_03185 [Myxococcales bacterium]|nr:hypothetical protein [Myxococcales bacterium]
MATLERGATIIALALLVAAPCGCAKRGATLALDKRLLVRAGSTYAVAGVSVKVLHIAMASATDKQGRDNHHILMDLSVRAKDGKMSKVALVGATPREAAGLVFTAGALGFRWGAKPATASLTIKRR